ncbi:MAG: cache domain-containing protein [Alphaproteobacteria bacterium]|nr:cache domain-containing protein [Alphaproteobacteria bacterium]
MTMKITTRIYLMIGLTLLGMLTVFLSSSYYLETEITHERVDQTRLLVEAGDSLIEKYIARQKAGEFSVEEAQRRALVSLSGLRYDTQNYFWINDMNGEMLSHPMASLVNTNVLNMQDARGNKLVSAFINIAKNKGQGEYQYFWPPDKTAKLKISYVKVIPQWNWIIGTGVYADDIASNVWDVQKKLGAAVLAFLLVSLLIASVLGKKISAPAIALTTIMHRLAHGDIAVEVAIDSQIQELDEMAKAVQIFKENLIERIKLEENFRIAKENADTANRAKSEFLANMSHELRTPLNSIMGMNRILQESGLAAEQQELAEIMFRSSTNLLEIVNDILDLSKIEAGETILEHIGFDPKHVLNTVAASLDSVASEKSVYIERHFSEDVFPYLLGDPTRLSRILMNLVGNAIKYTEKGHVEIHASCDRPDETHATFRCKVVDTGIGIPKDKLESIFDKFVQADASTTRKYGGTGLGLAITRHLVDIMGGKIGVESHEGGGSTFWFTIPFEITDRLHEEKHVRHQKALLGTVLPEKARILVAEDHPLNQMLIKKTMQKFGIGHFEVVATGVEVLRLWQEAAWDVILMDCHMPEKNGYDATEEIRSLEKETGAHIPIVAMTANAMTSDREKCLLCGMDDYISKPINVDALQETLGRWLRFNKEPPSFNS